MWGDARQDKVRAGHLSRGAYLEDSAAVYLKTFTMMGVQAYNIGDRDLALGLPLLQKLQKEAKFPFLSANLLDAQGKPVFEPSVVLEVGGQKVAVIGVITALFVNRQQFATANNVTIEVPAHAVAREVARHKAAGIELIAVLAHLNDTEIEAVAKANPDVDFILGGQATQMQRVLKHVEGAWVANAYQRGKSSAGPRDRSAALSVAGQRRDLWPVRQTTDIGRGKPWSTISLRSPRVAPRCVRQA